MELVLHAVMVSISLSLSLSLWLAKPVGTRSYRRTQAEERGGIKKCIGGGGGRQQERSDFSATSINPAMMPMHNITRYLYIYLIHLSLSLVFLFFFTSRSVELLVC